INNAPFDDFYEAKLNKKGGDIVMITRRFKDVRGRLYYLQFSINPEIRGQTLDMLKKTFLIAIPIIIFIVLIGGFLLTRRVLKPVAKLIRSAKAVSVKQKDLYLPVSDSGDELDQLAQAFNDVFKRLRDSYSQIVKFTADASHELRLPITAIKGEAEIVLERERNTDEYKKVIESVVEEMDRLSVTINRLLELTRSDSGEEVSVFADIQLGDLVVRLVNFYSALAETKNIMLSFSSKHDNVSIKGDRSRIQELFSNLIENAIKYTPESGSIEVSVSKAQKTCSVSVQDSGIGIPQEEQKNIFKRFYRVDKSRSRDEGGVGLGLSIVQMIANEHNAAIEVESDLGKGTCFTVTFPSS
ncbi:ATP-binding protein, partial [Elusimicrobiota bacterium]